MLEPEFADELRESILDTMLDTLLEEEERAELLLATSPELRARIVAKVDAGSVQGAGSITGQVWDDIWSSRSMLRELACALILPPPISARNVEVLAMARAEWTGADIRARHPWPQTESLLPKEILRAINATTEICILTMEVTKAWTQVHSRDFLPLWKSSAYARLEVSHKLAAALCLTDTPDDFQIRAPWEAWSLIVPDGLLGTEPARLWCFGAEPAFVMSRAGHLALWDEGAVGGRVAAEMLRSLVRGACVVLSDPDRVKPDGKWRGDAARRAGKRSGPPPEGTRYVLAHPVSIDLREEVHSALTSNGRKGGAPKAQFLVRGHPRNQPYGSGHALRKQIWIEPHWKGPEDARILLRSHRA